MSLEQAVVQLEQTNAALQEEVVRFRDASMGLNNIWPTVTEGRQNTADGKYFSVPGSGTYMRLYRRNGSSSSLIAEYPSKEAMVEAINTATADAEARANAAADRADLYADDRQFAFLQRLREQASVYLNFEKGEYRIDSGEEVVNTLDSPLVSFTRNSAVGVLSPNGYMRSVPANEVARYWEKGKCQGALIQGPRTNYALYNNDATNAAWNKYRVTVTDGFEDPYGGMTAQKITETTDTGIHTIAQNTSVQAGEFWAAAFSVKPLERAHFQIRIAGSGMDYAQLSFNTNDEDNPVSFITPGASAIVTKQPNGYWRAEMKLPAALQTGALTASFLISSESDNSSYTGDGVSSALYADMQIEKVGKDGWLSSPIKTWGSPVTRPADVLSVDARPLMHGTEATLFVRFHPLRNGAFPAPIALFTGYSSPTTHIRFEPYAKRWRVTGEGTGSGIDLSAFSTEPSGDEYACAATWGQGELYGAGDGEVTDTLSFSGRMSQDLLIGRSYNADTTVFNSGIKEVLLLPFKLSRAELQALTSGWGE